MEYAYHVTLREFARSISERGLLPRFHDDVGEECIFVETDRAEAEVYSSPETVTLRFALGATLVANDEGEYLIFKRVPPNDIEVFSGPGATVSVPLAEYVRDLVVGRDR